MKIMAVPGVMFVASLLACPLALLLRVSFFESAQGVGFYKPNTWSIQSYQEFLSDPTSREVTLFTIVTGLGITGITLLIAYPVALFISGLSPFSRRLAVGLVLLPKLCNVLVLVYGLQLILSGDGPISSVILWLGGSDEPVMLYRNLLGMIIGEVYLLLPYAILLLLLGILQVDPSLVAAARGLGASPWQTFWRITWPLSLPGVFAAGQLTLVWALSAILGPRLLGGEQETTLAVEVQRQALENLRWPRGAATAVILVVLLGLTVALTARVNPFRKAVA